MNKLLDEHFWQEATLAEVEAEIARGADVNATDDRGNTPLHHALQTGVVKFFQNVLLDEGSGGNAQSEGIFGNNSPLYLLIMFGKTKRIVRKTRSMIKALENAGADIKAQNENGDIPKIHAARVFINEATKDSPDADTKNKMLLAIRELLPDLMKGSRSLKDGDTILELVVAFLEEHFGL